MLPTTPGANKQDVIELCRLMVESFHHVQDTNNFIETQSTAQDGPRTGLVFPFIELETSMMQKYNAMVARKEHVSTTRPSLPAQIWPPTLGIVLPMLHRSCQLHFEWSVALWEWWSRCALPTAPMVCLWKCSCSREGKCHAPMYANE